MKREFYISVDGVKGPYETQAEAEFWADECLKTVGKLPNKRRRKVLILEQVMTKVAGDERA